MKTRWLVRMLAADSFFVVFQPLVSTQQQRTASEQVVFYALAGSSWWIVVESYDAAGGDFDLSLSCGLPPPPPPGECTGDTTVTLSGGTADVSMQDNSTGTDDAVVSCLEAGACPSGEDRVVAIDFPAGYTDLELTFDHTAAGDQIYALFADPMCMELDCYDPYPATTDTYTFLDVSDGSAAVTLYLVIDACAAGNGADTSITLTALP